MIRLEDDLLLPFAAAVPKATKDGSARVTVLRQRQVGGSVTAGHHQRQPPDPCAYQEEQPSYFIHGPWHFPVNAAIAWFLGPQSKTFIGPNSPIVNRLYDRVQFPEELVAVTAPMFAHKIAKGYGDPVGRVVKEINGIPIKNSSACGDYP